MMGELRNRLLANWQAAAIFAIFLLTFITFNILFDAASQANYFKEILAALIGTILAAVVTTMLLKSQTRGQELKEQNVEVFRSKLRVYDRFISRAVDSLNDDKLGADEVRELKKLAYQIALISADDTVATVTGFIRSHFVSMDEEYRMPEVINSFRLDLALKGVEALDSGDLDIIETALSDPSALQADTADERLAFLRSGLEEESKGRFDLSNLITTPACNTPQGRGFQIDFEKSGVALMLDAAFSEDVEQPVDAYFLLEDILQAKEERFMQRVLAMGFSPTDPESGVGPEAIVILNSESGETRAVGTLTIKELSDTIAALMKI